MNLYINRTLAKEKGLIIDESTKRYNELESYYKYLFENFLLSKINLYFFVDKINKSEIGFECPIVNKKVPSGLKEYFTFNYIFNVNDFFIEKLSKEDLLLLSSSYDRKISNSIQLTDLIRRTYKYVIKNDSIDTLNNGSIILKIYYKLKERNDDMDIYIERFKSALEFIDGIRFDIHELVERELNTNCDVLVHMR